MQGQLPLVSTAIAKTAQRLPSYLPAIYRDDPFLGQYLWAFEQVLLNLETQIGNLATLFDPMAAPEEFLPWLSTWVAFTLRADLEPAQQRQFLSQIVPLYRRRGTKENLRNLLSIFTGGKPTITESDNAGPAHHFTITLILPKTVDVDGETRDVSPDERLRQITIAHGLIDLEKPAHTDYELNPEFPSMQIGVTSHVGVDTLLGTIDTGDTRDLTIAATDSTTRATPDAAPRRRRAKRKASDAPHDAAATPRTPRTPRSAKPKADEKPPVAPDEPRPKRRRRKRDND